MNKIERYYAACVEERDELYSLSVELLAVLKIWMLCHKINESYNTNLLSRSTEVINRADKII